MERLAELGTVLEVCPGSNIALRVFSDFESHPLRALKAAGVRVCLNSDDPPFFHTSLSREYAIASEAMDFSDAELNAMTRTALEAAFFRNEERNNNEESSWTASLSSIIRWCSTS